jgi:hypothetical protein
MPKQDQLEIIGPGGKIEFYDLDPEKGVTNIGRDPQNDVVVDSPGVALFHAVLDHRQRPYQLMVLSEEAKTTLDGQRLDANVFKELHTWDTVEIDGYAIILLEGVVPAAAAEPVRLPAVAGAPVPAPVPEVPAAPLARPGRLAVPPPDQGDEVIVTELSARQWTVDVDQTATAQLTVVNGGDIVASFNVKVEGLDPSWVTISPRQVNLYEGARATVTISFVPPRLPSSLAGGHPLAVVVTSSNYPGRVSRLGASLIINPYYEFTVGELAPKQQTVSWRKPTGQVTLPISNKGNSETPFRLEGADDERGCRFEFNVPGEEAGLVKQAELRLAPDETLLVPIGVTPIRRRLIALRKRAYAFTVTTTSVEGIQVPRSVMGQVKAKPLIGPGLLLLMLLCLAALMVFLLRPASTPLLAIGNSSPKPNEAVTLTYNAARFASQSPRNVFNRLNGLFLDPTLEYRARQGEWTTVKGPADLQNTEGTVTHIPPENGRYRLLADTWLSKLVIMLEGVSREVSVFVTPVEPEIVVFRSDKDRVLVGEQVTVYWQVADAEVVKLEANGIPETMQDAELESGNRTFTLEQDTTFTLIVSNNSWPEPVQKPLRIMVLVPTRTPIPTPVIVRFDVDPLTITSGDTVRISWEVTGADTVSIDPLGQDFLLVGDVGSQPTSLTNYKLTAIKTAEDGTQVKNSTSKEVFVNPQPTPTPVPVAPEIQVFEATPKEVIIGEDQSVQLTWSVAGTTTNIEITAPDFKLSGLKAQDYVTVTVQETTLFVLTAYNGDLSRSAPAEVTALEATPEPTPKPPPTATATPFPLPVLAYYIAEGLNPPDDEVVFQTSYEGEDGMIYVYDVEVGSRITIKWKVNNADTVVVAPFGAQPTEGEVVPPAAVVAPATYELTAKNNDGNNEIHAFLQIEITSPNPPQAPYNVRGTEDAAGKKNTIKWSYTDLDRALITGFRIYRAEVPPGNDFVAVWTEYDPNAGEWTDEVDPTCGKAYYVVAVYVDPVTDEEKETEASSTSWYSQPCP